MRSRRRFWALVAKCASAYGRKSFVKICASVGTRVCRFVQAVLHESLQKTCSASRRDSSALNHFSHSSQSSTSEHFKRKQASLRASSCFERRVLCAASI